MLKRIVPIVFVFILVGVMVVQAVDNDKDEKDIKEEKQVPAASDEELNQLYNNIMSSQVEEEPEQDTVEEGLEIGLKAPNFELKTLDKKSIQLSDLKGKKTLINFFATWCHPCQIEMPILEKFSNEHSKEINIIAINIDPKANVKGFIKKLGISFPVLLDEKGHVNNKYQVLAIPTSYLVDEKGIIINKHIGVITEQQLNKITGISQKTP